MDEKFGTEWQDAVKREEVEWDAWKKAERKCKEAQEDMNKALIKATKQS